MPVSEATYLRLAVEDFKSGWELVCGELRRKPYMTNAHNRVASVLAFQLQRQLPLAAYQCATNQARLRIPNGTHYIPDAVVITAEAMEPHWEDTGVEAYSEPLPLVIEVWSPPAEGYDLETRLRDYQDRGDGEIWRIDPRNRSLTTWVRQLDGSYVERKYARGTVHLTSLPGVTVDLAALFRHARV